MYIIILGAGPASKSLVNLALEEGHEVTLIEKDEEKAQAVLKQYDIRVLNSTIAQGNILKEAEAERADALIATTEDDSANLMAMFLGKNLKIPQLVTMVNSSEHQEMFEQLGVQVLMNPEQIIAQYLYNFLEKSS
jgi:trk system potassium uptake protein TrkA